MEINRCSWAYVSPLMQHYHDYEWGNPVYDDLALFSKLMLDAQQAGLSWSIILNKREAFLKAFDNFNPFVMANYDQTKVEELLANPGIVRNKLKINAMISNAKLYVKHFSKEGSFSNLIWKHTNFKPVDHKLKSYQEMPTKNDVSDVISNELKRLGFKFVGSTVVYAFLQAVGVYNDHLVTCHCHKKYQKK
jgi:DNA-3-methyladenine glycosylase I